MLTLTPVTVGSVTVGPSQHGSAVPESPYCYPGSLYPDDGGGVATITPLVAGSITSVGVSVGAISGAAVSPRSLTVSTITPGTMKPVPVVPVTIPLS